MSSLFIILSFALLNFLLYFPAYLLNRKSTDIIPIKYFIGNEAKLPANFIRRYNLDVFRFNGDLAIILLLALLFISYKPFLVIVFSSAYVFSFIYLTYYYGVKHFFNTEALLNDDLKFLNQGITIAWSAHKLKLFFGICALILLSIFLFTISKSVLLQFSNSLLNILFLISIIALTLYSEVRYRDYRSIFGYLTFQSITAHLFRNISNSIKSIGVINKLQKVNYAELQQANNLKLTTKPDIHFIVVESYGINVYDRIENYKDLSSYLDKVQGQLHSKNLFISSNYSFSPISGGASWLSYSTILKGMKIATQSMYSYFLKDQNHLSYKPILKNLGDNGYDTYLLSSIGGFNNVKIDWDGICRFLGAEQYIKYHDLEYTGQHFGMGPSPPDQYALNKGLELIKQKDGNNPFAYFFITQNSHALWNSPSCVYPDWKNLNNIEVLENTESIKDVEKRYELAIKYQLETVFDFIKRNEEQNQLYVIVGDHQPIMFASEEKNLTPIHIVSDNEALIKDLKSFGFSNAVIPDSGAEIDHAGIQSLVTRLLSNHYGVKDAIEYIKEGII